MDPGQSQVETWHYIYMYIVGIQVLFHNQTCSRIQFVFKCIHTFLLSFENEHETLKHYSNQIAFPTIKHLPVY